MVRCCNVCSKKAGFKRQSTGDSPRQRRSAKKPREAEYAKAIGLLRCVLVQYMRVCLRQTPTSSPLNRISKVGCERVNICQNIWSLLVGVGANFAGEKWRGEVGGWLVNGLWHKPDSNVGNNKSIVGSL